MPFFTRLISLLTGGLSLASGFFKGVSNYAKIVFDFLREYFPKIIRIGFFAFLISYGSSLFIFVIYNIVYGSVIALSYFITPSTINIILYTIIGVLGYIAYIFLFKND